MHNLGVKSRALLKSATRQIADCLNVKMEEIIYTSGATEANNTALLGVALRYKNRGNHIILSKLEHPSEYVLANYLENLGFRISYVNNDSDTSSLACDNFISNSFFSEVILSCSFLRKSILSSKVLF